jgi:hypothetical protein
MATAEPSRESQTPSQASRIFAAPNPEIMARKARNRRRRVIITAVGGLVVLAVLALILLPWPVWNSQRVASTAGACGTWELMAGTYPLLHSPVDIRLQGVAALAPDNVWAVGNTTKRIDGSLETLVVHWNGSGWERVSSPHPDPESLAQQELRIEAELTGVAASGPDDIWAVGWQTLGSMMLHWDGQAWSNVRLPHVGAGFKEYLYGVAARAPDDVWAVGSAREEQARLILHWDGSEWEVVVGKGEEYILSADMGYKAVTALAPDDAWAVGWVAEGGTAIQQALTSRWDGQAWTDVPSPALCRGAHRLEGVAAVAADDIWAVGGCTDDAAATDFSRYRPLVQHWDGRSWQLAQIPAPPAPVENLYLREVAAAAGDAVWAVGTYDGGVALLHWDGAAWSTSLLPHGDQPRTLTGLAAAGPDSVWAVGAQGPAGQPPDQMIAARFVPGACGGQ